MEITVSKKDVVWSYVAQFFSLGSSLFTLPLILNILSTEEIAMNYLMITVGSLVSLIDFGFAPQFGRNVTYVFSGAQKLKREGINSNVGGNVNYRLLKGLILVAKKVYMYMSVAVLVLMLSLGTWYIWSVTNGFTNVDNALWIWLLYTVSTFFNVYFCYYSSLLTGRGFIKEGKMAVMTSRIVYIVISYILLLAGWGLMAVCIANFVSPFVDRWMSYHYFYDRELKRKLSEAKVESSDKKEIFDAIWHNARKLGVSSVCAYLTMRASMFFAGLYLTSSAIASYGLMNQFVGIITGISGTLFGSYIPKITSHIASNDREGMIRSFSWAMNVNYLMFFVGSIVLVLAGPLALSLIGSKAELPETPMLIVFLIIILLETNHSNYCTLIAMGNSVPFYKPGLFFAVTIAGLDFVVLKYTELGLWGIILVQGIVQLSFNNWYWPRWVCKETHTSFIQFVLIGFLESWKMARRVIKR